jgi:gamma-glutamyltranspeptidase / glutathione hydrolase
VATAFALAAVEPNASGLGGGGYLVLKMAQADTPIFLDYREMAPEKAVSNQYYAVGTDFGKITKYGGKSAGVPGMVAGLLSLHKKYGVLPLKTVLSEPIEYARKGFSISDKLSGIILDKYDILSANSDASNIFLVDLLPPPTGTILKNPQLARSIQFIIEQGVKEFYEGSIAKSIVETMQSENGLITLSDLAKYQPKYSSPVVGNYRGYQIISTAPSSGGGTHLIELLNIMENYDLKSMGHNSAEYVHVLSEAMKIILKDKDQFMGDPAFSEVPVQQLTDKEYARGLKNLISLDKARFDYKPNLSLSNESGSTTHLSVVDKDRNIIALTQSINLWFSSGIVANGTGILLNNHMADFADKPDQINSVEPFKRPVSSIAPTIVLKDGNPVLTIGTPGGSRIIGALAQIIINIIDFDMEIDEAIQAARIHSQGKYLYLEGRISKETGDKLADIGHNVKYKENFDAYFGGAQGILINHDSGNLIGGADMRRDGVAVGY